MQSRIGSKSKLGHYASVKDLQIGKDVNKKSNKKHKLSKNHSQSQTKLKSVVKGAKNN